MTAQILKVETFDLVVFGGTGDLSYRKLYPAMFRRYRRPAFAGDPRHRRIAQKHELAGIHGAPSAKPSSASIRSMPPIPTRSKVSSRLLDYVTLSMLAATPAGLNFDQSWATTRRASALFTSPRRPNCSDKSRIGFRLHRLITPAARADRRKANWQGRRVGRRDQRRLGRSVRGKPDLPHRSLSRQGDGAEPHGAALRQRLVRAVVELRRISIMCRSPWPKPSASKAARAITTNPARCATWCRTICCSCCAWWRWSRRPRSIADAVRDEKLKVLQSLLPIDAEQCVASVTVRGQYRAGAASATPCPAISTEVGRSRQRHRNLRRAETRNRELALGGRSLLSAHRQAIARTHLRNRRRLPQGARIRCFRQRRAGLPDANCVIRLQPDEGIKLWLMIKEPGPGGFRLAARAARHELRRSFRRQRARGL